MNIKTKEIKFICFMLASILAIGVFGEVSAIADINNDDLMDFENEDQYSFPIMEDENEGNEALGQIAAWLIVISNFTVAISIFIFWTNRYAPLNSNFKTGLLNLNRFQKKHLMWFHYYLNPILAGIALWHWLSSRCKSTSLPEWGLSIMFILVILGIFLKYKIGPKPLRKIIYQIHTQPVIFLVMVLTLTIGHVIVD